MKKLTLLTLILATLAIVNGCGPKQEAPKSVADVQQTTGDDTIPQTSTTDDAIPQTSTTDDAIPQTSTTDDAIPQTSTADGTIPQTSTTDDNIPETITTDGIFKYTITTDIAIEKDTVVIPIAVHSVNGHSYKYDLDCDGDGEFEYQGLKGNDDDYVYQGMSVNKCTYKKNSGKHQIWVRGEIPGIYLCTKDNDIGEGCPDGAKCRPPIEWKNDSNDAVLP